LHLKHLLKLQIEQSANLSEQGLQPLSSYNGPSGLVHDTKH